MVRDKVPQQQKKRHLLLKMEQKLRNQQTVVSSATPDAVRVC